MKVAFLGNSNNNNFAALRYFRDLGIEADLLLHANELNHFKPEADSWYYKQWEQYIKKSNYTNHINRFHFNDIGILRKQLAKYDRIISYGLLPADLKALDKKLDIYFPISVGLDWFEIHSSVGIIKSTYQKYVQRKMADGLRNRTRTSLLPLSFDVTTANKYAELGINPVVALYPFIYNKEFANNIEIDEVTHVIVKKINQYRLIIMQHSRQLWFENDTNVEISIEKLSYKNDELIYGFANFLLEKPEERKSDLLLLSEYGNAVNLSKELIQKLGIQKNVIWLPLLPRKALMYIMQYVNLGVGELGIQGLWGAGPLEYLSMGIPVVNNYSIDTTQYETAQKVPMPPIIKASNRAEIFDILCSLETNQPYFQSLGIKGKEWFDNYQGDGAAKNLVRIMNSNY